MKSKKILDNTINRHTYHLAQMFILDYWNRAELNRNRRRYYGGVEGKEIRRPCWKFQKVKKQYMSTNWKIKKSYSNWSNRVWVKIVI